MLETKENPSMSNTRKSRRKVPKDKQGELEHELFVGFAFLGFTLLNRASWR